MKRAAFSQPLVATVRGGKREVSLRGRLDLNGNVHLPSKATGESWEGTEAQSCHREDEASLENLGLKSQESQHCISQGR